MKAIRQQQYKATRNCDSAGETLNAIFIFYFNLSSVWRKISHHNLSLTRNSVKICTCSYHENLTGSSMCSSISPQLHNGGSLETTTYVFLILPSVNSISGKVLASNVVLSYTFNSYHLFIQYMYYDSSNIPCDLHITDVTQNKTGMYTKESSQQTFRIPNMHLDVKFERAYHNHNNEILQTRKENMISNNLWW